MLTTFAVIALFASFSSPAKPHALAVGVADINSGRPLVGAQVRIPALGLLQRAGDGMGQAVFSPVPAQRLRVEARMVGYAPMDVDVLVRDADDTVEVVLLMQSRAPTLDTIRTTATRLTTPAAREIDARERMGIGRFLTDSVLRHAQTRALPLVLASRFMGLRTYTDPTGRLAIESPRPVGTLSSARCVPITFLDGWEWQDPDFSMLNTADVWTVEWYTGDSAPAQYRRPGHGCGTLLIWTKFAVDPSGAGEPR